jgi:septum formation protein
MLGVKDLVILPANTDETVTGLPPEETVQAIALEKAKAVAGSVAASDIIIAADTLVYLDGGALGKPRDAADAAAMLRRLSGNRHAVYTGVALIQGDKELTFFERTEVYFRALSEEEIAAYIRTGEPMDKAGAYGAQGRGAAFIERIEGDFFNVVGLPLCRLALTLRELGVDLIGTAPV